MRLRVLGIVLAGGKGSRLYPLTKERAKPAVPFGGKYRIVDFVLSNFINSGINSIYVLTQFRSQSLLQHLNEGWQFGGLLKKDRKSTRLNSSHQIISYAVFCLKKKKNKTVMTMIIDCWELATV